MKYRTLRVLSLTIVIAAGIALVAQGLWGLLTAPTGEESAAALRVLTGGVIVFGYLAYSRAMWNR